LNGNYYCLLKQTPITFQQSRLTYKWNKWNVKNNKLIKQVVYKTTNQYINMVKNNKIKQKKDQRNINISLGTEFKEASKKVFMCALSKKSFWNPS